MPAGAAPAEFIAPVAGVPPEPRPSALARLRASRPSGAWLGIGAGAMVVTFVVGLLCGRWTAGPTESAKSDKATAAKAEPSKPGATAGVADKASPAKPSPAAKPAESPKSGKAAFSSKAARAAIDRAAARTKGCRGRGDPSSASVNVTFAPSGKVSEVTVTTPRYAGTKAGRCVIARLSDARVPEFSGSPVTLKRTVKIR